MKIRAPLFALMVSLATLELLPASELSARPNVLVLFADDQRADTIRALGNPLIQTPNLDRLVARGLSFRQAYMQGSNNIATCIPSRAMLMSGRPLFRIDETLLRDETWPTAFGRAGYVTFLAGKWHNGAESLKRSFQGGRALLLDGMTNPLKAKLRDLEDGKLSRPEVSPKHACETIADEVIEFLKEPKDGPFLCYVSFDAPHDPHIVPEDFPIHYDPAKIPLPPSFLPQHPWDNGEMTVRDELLLPWPRSPEKVRKMIADYYRYVSYLDAQIGRILDALDASPEGQNTLVVFSSDSGVALGSHGLVGKQNLYDLSSIRVPLILAGCGIAAGKQTEAMCFLYDVFPTLGKLCSVPPPKTSEGREFTRTLQDPGQPLRERMFYAYKDAQRAVRDDRWKLIRYPLVDRTQLFDLKTDPQEATNLAERPEFAAKVAEMMGLLKSEMLISGDSAPLTINTSRTPDWTPPTPQKTQ